MKRSYGTAAIFTALCFIFTGCGASSPETPPAPPAEDWTLSVANVYQFFGYNKIKLETKKDGVITDIPDLYYDIVDESVCRIENGYVEGLKVGETDVYAQTVAGQEVKFTVTVRDPDTFRYDREVRTYEERANAGQIRSGGTLFVGDSFFDTFNFWKTFGTDFEGLNAYSVGISGSESSHWMVCRDRLINRFTPKNIVIHIGTNDINASTIIFSVNDYYSIITRFLSTVMEENPQAEVYYFGIEDRNGEMGGRNDYSYAVTEKIRTEFAEGRAAFHYIDSPSVFNPEKSKYVSGDNIHPSSVGYAYYVKTLKELVSF